MEAMAFSWPLVWRTTGFLREQAMASCSLNTRSWTGRGTWHQTLSIPISPTTGHRRIYGSIS